MFYKYIFIHCLCAIFGIITASYTPIVVYHGLGDNCCSPNMMRFTGLLQKALPGVFIHSVRIGKTPDEDRKKSLLDNMNRQIDEVCKQLADIEELKSGFNAIGLSQGGQFLRAYVERCNSPSVKKLITLGSQHEGVMALPGCKETSRTDPKLTIEESQSTSSSSTWNLFELFSQTDNRPWFPRSPIGRMVSFFKEIFESDPNCAWWKRLVILGVYSPIVRSQVVQAQYFKDPKNLEAYRQSNQFLLDINNDHINSEKFNQTYIQNMLKLEAFYMYMFEDDTVVVPRESSWFGRFDPRTSQVKYITDKSIDNDRLGLKELASRNAVFLLKLPGEHLRLSADFIQNDLAQILK